MCNKNGKLDDVLNSNWLPVKDRIWMNTAKLAYKGLHDQNLPYHLKLQCKIITQNSREKSSKKTIYNLKKLPYLKLALRKSFIT